MGSKVELQWVPFLYKRPCRVLYFYEPILYAPPAGPFLALPPSLVLSPLKDPTPSPYPPVPLSKPTSRIVLIHSFLTFNF